MISPELQEVLMLSLFVGAVSSCITTPLAVGIAWLFHSYTIPGKVLLQTLFQVPLVMPPVALGYLLIVVLGKNGFLGRLLFDWFGMQFIYSTSAVVIAAVIVSFPLVFRSIQTAFEMAPRGLEVAAATLGAGPVRQFFTITLPLLAPGILGGIVLGFARAIGEFGATITFAGNVPGVTQTLPLKIYALMQVPGKEAEALWVTLFSIGLAFGAIIGAHLLTRFQMRRRGV